MHLEWARDWLQKAEKTAVESEDVWKSMAEMRIAIDNVILAIEDLMKG